MEYCAYCKYNTYDSTRSDGGYYCGCSESENYGAPTFWNDHCDEWEDRRHEN